MDALRNIVKSLKEYYDNASANVENLVISEVKEITRGWETELHSFNVTFKETGHQIIKKRVIRLYPGKWAAEKASREFKVMIYLFNTGYPVPKVFHLKTDENTLGKPFIIMEKIKGHNMIDDLLIGPESKRESLLSQIIRLWVNLHDMKYPDELNYFGIKDTQGYISRILNLTRKNIENYNIQWMEPVLDWLDKHKATVSSERLSIIHRDFHPENIMIQENGSPVVLDWGAATVGDYRDDLAWTILLGIAYSDPSFRETILGAYQKISKRKVCDIEFFEVMAILRRLQDIVVSFKKGPEEISMRPDATEKIRQDLVQHRRVYDLLRERTDLRILELEQFFDSL